MRRSAFTWIELIFVIVILGILAATAVAKLGGMSDRAFEVQMKAFVGTLNRTSGGGFWFKSLEDGLNGSVVNPDYDNTIDQYIEVLPGYEAEPKLTKCNAEGTGIFLRYQLAVIYEIHCKDGSLSESPRFRLYNFTESRYID